ncbi:MAG: 23S rRNA (uracil(1939)-C(5))-methyltransferase RlmD [Eubacteriales bacterium]
MKKNDVYTVEITDLNNLGNGVGRIEGKAVFVPRAVDGDTLRVKIIKDTKDYAVARIEEVLTASPHRQESGCPVSNRCGGCVYRHITYAHELELKRSYVRSAFRKAGIEVDVAPTLFGDECGYRNKVQYPVGEGMTVGFYAPRSHEIVPCGDCALQKPIFTPIIATLQTLLRQAGVIPYREEDGSGLLRHLFLRTSASGEVMVTLVTTSRPFPAAQEIAEKLRTAHPEVVSVVRNFNDLRSNVILGDRCETISGADVLTDRLCGLTFRLSLLSFYQVNHDIAEVLYQKAAELADLRPGDRVADLFCGAGTIGLSVAAMNPASSLIGVEIIPEAVENARENARQNGIRNATFLCTDANTAELEGVDVIFLDPPRKGCEETLVKRIADLAPRRVVYISCNPDTLARDVARFIEAGYAPETVYPVDLFPRTGHVECVVSISRVEE